MKTAYIGLAVHYPPDDMPDADTDVIIFDDTSPHGQLGAYVGHDEEGALWVNAQGEGVAGVVAWCEMPKLQPPKEPRLFRTKTGELVDLSGWRLPA